MRLTLAHRRYNAVASPHVFAVDQADFENAVLVRSREKAVVVDFWAPWCGPCRALTPILERLINERNGEVLLAKVNIDENPDLAGSFGIQSIPTVIAFKNGEAVLDFMGLLPEEELREFINRLTPTPADRLVQQALGIERTKPAEAEGILRQAVELDRHHEPAQIALARVLLAQGKDAQAKEILDNLGAGEELDSMRAKVSLHELAHLCDEATARQRMEIDPKDAQARYDIGCALGAQGKYAEALEMLYSAAELDRKFAASKVRDTMVKVFQAIGVRSAQADEYRKKLTALLY
jgi:putative thioredoxin